MWLDERALLRRARWAYELGRARDAVVRVGWVFPAALLAATVTHWSPGLVAMVCAGCCAHLLLWLGDQTVLRRLAPLLVLVLLYGPFVATC